VVRIQAPVRIVIPEVATLGKDRVESRVPHEEDGALVVLRDGDKTFHVPKPGHRVSGRLVGLSDEAITVRDRGDRTIHVPRAAVERLELRHGGEHKGAGMLLGAIAGFGARYAIGYAAEKNCSGWCMPEVAGAGLGLLMVLPGMALGGSAAEGRWEPVSTEKLRVGIAPGRGGVGAAVSISGSDVTSGFALGASSPGGEPPTRETIALRSRARPGSVPARGSRAARWPAPLRRAS
jgi:hypothetical protein